MEERKQSAGLKTGEIILLVLLAAVVVSLFAILITQAALKGNESKEASVGADKPIIQMQDGGDETSAQTENADNTVSYDYMSDNTPSESAAEQEKEIPDDNDDGGDTEFVDTTEWTKGWD